MTPSNMKIGILLSGGIDSSALIGHYLDKGFEVWPIYIQCKLPWETIELVATKKFLRRIRQSVKQKKLHKLKTLEVSLENAYRENWSVKGQTPDESSEDSEVFLPGRNLLLITKAFLYLSSVQVYRLAIGTLKGNPFKDGNRDYFKSLEKILSQSFNDNIKIEAPFSDLSKNSVIKRFRHLPLQLTLSCLQPIGPVHCGKCNKCAERKKGFREALIPDKTIYKN